MKKIYKDKILNIKDTDIFDNIFLFEYFTNTLPQPLSKRGIKVVYLRDVLEKHKNTEVEKRVSEKPAMWSEVYSPKDELTIFTELFETALREEKKIHIIWVTLWEEIQILEKYYEELGFLREDINAFDINFSIPLVTVSCHIENLMWRGSDYKRMREQLFFNPPIRESGQNKAIFKWITRGVIAWIHLWEFTPEKQEFIWDCIRNEKILPIHMGKVLEYNLEEIWFEGEKGELQIKY